MVVYELPLNEVVFDFYDRLKSLSRGYASFDYRIEDYHEGDLVKLSLLVNHEPVDALACITHRMRAEGRGRQLCERLKELIPRQLFKIPIQAAVGGRIVARETISAMRKDVTAKCYGGDVTRETKAAGPPEGRQEADAHLRQGGHPAKRLHRGAPDERDLSATGCRVRSREAGRARLCRRPAQWGAR